MFSDEEFSDEEFSDEEFSDEDSADQTGPRPQPADWGEILPLSPGTIPHDPPDENDPPDELEAEANRPWAEGLTAAVNSTPEHEHPDVRVLLNELAPGGR